MPLRHDRTPEVRQNRTPRRIRGGPGRVAFPAAAVLSTVAGLAAFALAGSAVAQTGAGPERASDPPPRRPVVSEGRAPVATIADRRTSEYRVGLELRRQLRALYRDRPSPSDLRAAAAIAVVAAELTPDDPEAWRIVRDAARLAEDDALTRRAILRLVELDPDDQVALLDRLQLAVEDRGSTVESRTEFLRYLVDAGKSGRLSAPVAGILALDLALLRQRAGDQAGFVEALLDGLDLDPSNAVIARIAYDFFRANAVDPVDEAELLVNLLMANPSNIRVAEELGRLLFTHGAFRAASRMFAFAGGFSETSGPQARAIPDQLIADSVSADWAAGDLRVAWSRLDALARDTAIVHEQLVAQRARSEERSPGSTADLIELPPRALMPRVPSVVRLAMLSIEGVQITGRRPAPRIDEPDDETSADGGDPDRDADGVEPAPPVDTFLDDVTLDVMDQFDYRIRVLDGAPDAETPEMRARRASERLEHAFVALWLADDLPAAEARVSEADAIDPLQDRLRERFDGWFALRRGDPATAIATLTPLADDIVARLGLAMAHEMAGDAATARVELRAIAVVARGTLIGTWAERRLLVDYRERLRPSPTADRLEGLIATIPSSVERIANDPPSGLQLRIRFSRLRFGPVDPLTLEVELVNNGPLPLGIGAGAAIDPNLVLLSELTVASQGKEDFDPVIVDLGRRLRLEPRERLAFEVDLRTHPVGSRIATHLMSGSFLGVSGYVNHAVEMVSAGPSTRTRTTMVAGPLGTDAETRTARIDGIALLAPRADGSLALADEVSDRVLRVRRMGTDPVDLESIVAVARFATRDVDAAAQTGLRDLREDSRNALVRAMQTMDDATFAWTVCTTSTLTGEDSIVRRRIETTDSRLLKIVWMLYGPQKTGDPLLARLVESSDPLVAAVATTIRERIAAAAAGPQP